MRGSKGQGVLMAVLLLGILMATVIIFGAKRQADVSVLTGRLDASQTAAEVLSGASKRVQSIYANEASCDPTSLNNRISGLTALGTNPNALGFGGSGLAFAVAQPSYSGGSQRFNICTPASGQTGCRQIAVNLENLIYVVTVGNVVAMSPTPVAPNLPGDCPQDVNVHLSVAIGGSVYNQWSTLVNICTLRSCNHNLTGSNTDAGDPTALTPSSFDGAVATIPGGSLQTTACTVAPTTLPAHYYGAMTDSANAKINADDIRWARRYLETGGADVGEVSNLYVTGAGAVPMACPVANSSGQCVGRACVPVFDLNYDRNNSEADLGILELYLRGYMLSLPVTNLR